jgi:hypothetical protein
MYSLLYYHCNGASNKTTFKKYIHTYVPKNPVPLTGQPNMELVNTGQHVHTQNCKHEYRSRIGTRIDSTTQYREH